jgi:hypothetical protein
MTAEEERVAKKALSGMWKRAGFTKVKGDYYILEGESCLREIPSMPLDHLA